jgi:hypothetical protein
MLRNLTAACILLFLAACATAAQHDKAQWAEGVIVAMNMCSQDGSAQHTKDPEGNRAYCAREVMVGSHVPKCVCRDEGQTAAEREEVEQYMRNAAAARQVIRGN